MRNLITSVVIVIITITFVACNQSKPKEGQVFGVLFNSDGTKYAEGVSVFVINAKEIGSKQEIDLKSKTNNKGEFVIENIVAGDYILGILKQPEFDRIAGTGNLPMPILGLVNSKGKTVNFSMREGVGINLGNIEVTEVTQL